MKMKRNCIIQKQSKGPSHQVRYPLYLGLNNIDYLRTIAWLSKYQFGTFRKKKNIDSDP